ncbi:MAG: hypothetical protein ABI724_17665 [Betaproteobacteria bacterium]
MNATPSSAHATLVREMQRVSRLHVERAADPPRARGVLRIATWQAKRLARTYEDLAAQQRYGDAVRFFENDLYGGAGFVERDADLSRVVPMMVRMLPERVVATVAEATELNALSQELDQALYARLSTQGDELTVAEYCRAYRESDNRAMRMRQIALIGEIGAALDIYVRKPLIGAALSMMRRPARLAGFAVLHDFLERGFAAFRKMQGAGEFLATIDRREREVMERIFAGDEAPFPDPLAGAQPSEQRTAASAAPP